MSLYQVLEYHMEFLEAFGCIWSSKEVLKAINGRAVHQSDLTGATPATCQSDAPRSLAFPWRDDTKRSPERPTKVAPEVRSDLLERHTKVARVLSSGDTKVEHHGATPQSDLPRSLPARATLAPRLKPSLYTLSRNLEEDARFRDRRSVLAHGRGDLGAGRPLPWARIDRELVFRKLSGIDFVVTGFEPNTIPTQPTN
ncbi:hypothetical protein F2Q69_00015280 [Brassica cretica]|uniref:Uncharacterized protein n=1 Tax=Brassica cretica TaxID=69181 RepID=A0A8S9R5L0_BRACR|nr:hypothetical protein F2Q69_00015280 [Brassica cretica]